MSATHASPRQPRIVGAPPWDSSGKAAVPLMECYRRGVNFAETKKFRRKIMKDHEELSVCWLTLTHHRPRFQAFPVTTITTTEPPPRMITHHHTSLAAKPPPSLPHITTLTTARITTLTTRVVTLTARTTLHHIRGGGWR